MNTICYFNDCNNPALPTGKCEKHRVRIKCSEASCYNQTYARNLCVRHGGKKLCSYLNCKANARCKGLCSKHGKPATKKICEERDCMKVAHNRRRCVYHGGSRKCKVPECISYSRHRGYCRRHVNGQGYLTETNYLDPIVSLTDKSTTMDPKVCEVNFFYTPLIGDETKIVFTDEEFVLLDYLIQ